jgi:glycerol-3-phosphate acyltransferase PlsY
MNVLLSALTIIIAYLLGSIPFAYIIGKLSGLDVRKVGDKNVWTFNVFRHAGLSAGIATLSANELVVFGAGVAAVIGHNWPVFLRFRGGRGLAVVIGALLALLPIEMLISAAIALVVLYATRNTIWFGVAMFIPLILLSIVLKEPLSLIIYSGALPCLSGLAHLWTTHHLSTEEQKEAVSFWVARKGDQENKGTG